MNLRCECYVLDSVVKAFRIEESKHSTEVYSRFESEFTVGWIDALNWSNKEERRKLFWC